MGALSAKLAPMSAAIFADTGPPDPGLASDAALASGDVDAGEARLRLSGLHCAGCAASVERALRSVVGVRDATVNSASQSARVRWDPACTGLPQVLDAVRSAGYGAAADEVAAARELRRFESRAAWPIPATSRPI
jgi:P-type Cu2+ transporter